MTAIDKDNYGSDYQTIRGSQSATAQTEIMCFLNGPRTLYLDEFTLATNTGSSTLTGQLWYAEDGADMDTAANDNTRINVGTFSLGTAEAATTQTVTLTEGRVAIPPYAKVFIEASGSYTDQVAFFARGSEFTV